jgi:RNA polymerase sigma factor (sigma-70 family)
MNRFIPERIGMSDEKERTDQWFVSSLQAHREAMFRAAMAILRRSAEAEDAVSIATINTYARLRSLKNRDSIRPYLLRATINAAYNQLRQRKHEDTAYEQMDLRDIAGPSETPLWMYLESLSPKLRIALQLRYGENLPLSEIGRVLDLPKGTVSARINRGLASLRRMMENEP